MAEPSPSYGNGTSFSPSSVAVDVGELCGANYCPGITATENPNLIKPDADKVNMLSGIFLGCMVGACLLVAFGVDSLKR